MQTFKYKAKDRSSDKVIEASIQADSEHSAAKLLIEQGYTPLDIKEDDPSASFLGRFSARITTKDKVILLRQLATLIGAGLPLVQALRTVSEQTENKAMRRVIDDIIVDVESGKTLSSAMAKHADVFDSTVVALVTAGEASGTLDEALKRVATQKEKDAAMMSKVRGAMVYPGIVMLVIVGVIIFMLVAVVPQVENLYDDLNQNLPLLTNIMIVSGRFLIEFWWLALIVLGVGIYFAKQYFDTESGIKVKDTFKLNVPLFKTMFRKLYMARFTRSGQTLLATGVPMLDMLSISADAVNNVVVAEEINRAADKVKGGKALSEALSREEYILPMVSQMIKIGEQSGKIDEMMGKTAQVYEDELDEQIKALTTTIEPLLMVVMAVVVGGMVGAILFPIYGLVSKIK